MAADNLAPTDTAAASKAPHGRDQVPLLLVAALAAGVGVVVLVSKEYQIVFSTALAWGLALYVTGALIGFLFGIPKVPDREAGAPQGTSGAAAGDDDGTNRLGQVQRVSKATSRRASGINSNLVEVSDWLTKIIVGVGLVELKRLPGYGESLANFIASSLQPANAPVHLTQAQLVSVAGAVALFFGVLGFISGYLMTRIFLAVIMNDADRDAEEASGWRLPEGEVVNTRTMLSGLISAVTDLQGKVVQMLSTPKAEPSPAPAAPDDATAAPAATSPPSMSPSVTDTGDSITMEAPAAPSAATPDAAERIVDAPPALPSAAPMQPPPSAARSVANAVLWVDDRPKQNALLVDRLRAAGVQVQQASHTNEAMAWLARRDFDLVITDMHRGENANDGQPSGLRLIEALHRLFDNEGARPRPRVVLYCSHRSVEQYGRLAIEAGAELATSSEVELLSLLSLLFPKAT